MHFGAQEAEAVLVEPEMVEFEIPLAEKEVEDFGAGTLALLKV